MPEIIQKKRVVNLVKDIICAGSVGVQCCCALRCNEAQLMHHELESGWKKTQTNI